MKAPCNGCEDRTMGCHSSCEQYKEFRKDCDERMAKREEFKRSMREANELVIRKHWRKMSGRG